MLYWLVLVCSVAVFVLVTHQAKSLLGRSASSADVHVDEYSRDNEARIKTISLIGERHCGTKWITKHLEDCFGSQVAVLNRYTRYKHWYQYREMVNDVRHYYPPNTAIVVAMFRDPFQWVNAMQKKPYHALDHHNLSWERFVTTPWSIGRGEKDKELLESNATNNATCVHRFKFKEVVPCTREDRNDWRNATHSYTNRGLMYELNHDGSGSSYESVVDLRRDKIKNFLDVRNYPAVASFFPVQYEYVVTRGTADLIKAIEKESGLKAQCQPSPPRELTTKELDASFVKWMNANIDWEVEKMVGYYERNTSYI